MVHQLGIAAMPVYVVWLTFFTTYVVSKHPEHHYSLNNYLPTTIYTACYGLTCYAVALLCCGLISYAVA